MSSRFVDSSREGRRLAPRFNRYDICEAYFVFALQSGEYVPILQKLKRIGFQPELGLSPLSLTPNGRAILDALAARDIRSLGVRYSGSGERRKHRTLTRPNSGTRRGA